MTVIILGRRHLFCNKLKLQLVGQLIILSILTISFGQQDGVKSESSSSEEFKPPLKARLTTDQQWIQTSLDRHNYLRSLHKSQKLVLNNTLSEISQAYSNYLLKRALDSYSRQQKVDFFQHNYDVLKQYKLGENLFYLADYYEKLNATLAVNLWYNEIKDYDFEFARVKSTSDPKSQIGHLTQLLWKDTTQMGTAYAAGKLPNGQVITFVTANYYPQGNLLLSGNFPQRLYLENVLPPIGAAENEVPDISARIHDSILYWEVPRANLTTPKSWIEAAVEKHNYLRKEYDFPEININEQLCEVSQSWANTLVEQGMKDFNQNYMINYYKNNYPAINKAKFGENIMYFISDGLIDPEYPVKLWYQEKRFYNFEARKTNVNISKTAKTEHFEQIIWKSTKYMGIAFASGELESGQILTFIVANYYPSGQRKQLEERIENIPYENIPNYPQFQQVVIKLFGKDFVCKFWNCYP